ncbi:MAG: hypothetical protein KatS3mg085_690 [Candidatus Dojkabacteria bacterium]|nr:MAG: hypothetical protein KatS3mg085_690 [Candidatus Dojkabacteria bacterium]
MARKKNTTDEKVIKLSVEQILTPASILLSSIILSLSLSLSFYFSFKNVQINTKETSDAGSNVADPVVVPDDANVKAQVSIDDDPVLGDRNKAKVAIVEFSDYECPFCKRHHQETFDQIVEEFVNTGKAIIVYRDFPLSFHDPLATTQALAAECVQDIAGDDKYFEYSKLIFETTNSNGNGMKEDQLYTLASQIGVNQDEVKNCVASDKFLDEIQRDIQDGTAAGINGTPGFIIGVLDENGNVDGVNVAGAQPYSVFKQVIEEQLERVN